MQETKERDQLIEDHLDYVRALAGQIKKQLSLQLDFDELVAYGHRGLVEAAERFDPSRGVAFTTFSYYRIRGAIFDGLRKMGWLGRAEYGRFLSASNDYFRNQQAREEAAPPGASSPGVEQTVAEVGQAVGDLAAIFITSLSARPTEDIPDTHTPDASDRLAEREEADAVATAMSHLPEKERRLVQLYYFEDKTLEEAGQALGLSKSWASRLHARAVRLLADHIAM